MLHLQGSYEYHLYKVFGMTRLRIEPSLPTPKVRILTVTPSSWQILKATKLEGLVWFNLRKSLVWFNQHFDYQNYLIEKIVWIAAATLITKTFFLIFRYVKLLLRLVTFLLFQFCLYFFFICIYASMDDVYW